jgi:hypothetical protein
MIDEYSDLAAYEFDLLFDSSVVKGENAEDGGLLESSGRTMIEFDPPLLAIDNESSPGRMSFASATVGDGAGPTGTNGKLATVQLKAVGLHNTALDLDNIAIVDTQGNLQPLLPPVGGTVLVNSAVNGKFRERCRPWFWTRLYGMEGEDDDPPGLGTIDCRDDSLVKTGHYAFKITGSPTQLKVLKTNLATWRLPLSGEAGETYKLSGWSYVTSDTPLGGLYRLDVRVKYTDGSSESFSVDFSKDPADWNTWQYRELEFTTVKPYKKFEVYVRFNKQPETAIAWFDDIRLVRQSDGWEVTQNGSFEGRCRPWFWTRLYGMEGEDDDPPGLGTIDCRDDSLVKTGHYAFKITGSPTQLKVLKTNLATWRLPLSGEAGETYKLSGWSYVTSDTPLGGLYRLDVRVKYTDGSSESFSVDFSKDPADWNTWQYRELEFTTVKPYKKFEVYVRFNKQPETAIAWFDDIRLVRQSP